MRQNHPNGALLWAPVAAAVTAMLLAGCAAGQDGVAAAATAPAGGPTPLASAAPTWSTTPAASPDVVPARLHTVPPPGGPAGPSYTAQPTQRAHRPGRTHPPKPPHRPKPPRRPKADGPDNVVQLVPASDPTRQAQLLQMLCSTAVPNVQCVFTPTGPLVPVLGPATLIAAPWPTCDGGGALKVHNSFTTESSDTLGVSVSWEIGKIVKLGVEASFSTTWSQSYTTTVDDEAEQPSFSVGYVYRAPPMLRATGDLFIREMGATLPATGTAPQWHSYWLTSVVFDSPDPSSAGHGSVAFVNRKMTPAERANCDKPAGTPSPQPGSDH